MAALREHLRAERALIKEQLTQLVGLESVFLEPDAAGTTQPQTDTYWQAADWVARELQNLGLSTQRHLCSDGSETIIATTTLSSLRAGDTSSPAAKSTPSGPVIWLYSHFDTVPLGDASAWDSPPLQLTERNGRWFGRGTADCKGSIITHLAALRALAALEDVPGERDPTIVLLIEGSEEAGGPGLTNLISTRPELFDADAYLIADAGNLAVGQPAITTSLRGNLRVTATARTLAGPIHSGEFGGVAPDAALALMHALTCLQAPDGTMRVDGVPTTSDTWEGRSYCPEVFIDDAGVLPDVRLMLEEPDDIATALWARPSFVVTGFTSTPAEAAFNVIAPTATAVLDVRVPATMNPHDFGEAVAAHLRAHTPFGAQLEVVVDDVNPGIITDTTGPAVSTLEESLRLSYTVASEEGKTEVARVGMGATIPLTTTLAAVNPDAEVLIYGIEEPACQVHSARESVHPEEIESIAVTEALFVLNYPRRWRRG